MVLKDELFEFFNISVISDLKWNVSLMLKLQHNLTYGSVGDTLTIDGQVMDGRQQQKHKLTWRFV